LLPLKRLYFRPLDPQNPHNLEQRYLSPRPPNTPPPSSKKERRKQENERKEGEGKKKKKKKNATPAGFEPALTNETDIKDIRVCRLNHSAKVSALS